MAARKNNKANPLTEADYRAVVEISEKLLQCRDRAALNRCIENEVMPLFAVQVAMYGLVDLDMTSAEGPRPVIKPFDAIGLSDGVSARLQAVIPRFAPYQKKFNELQASTRPVFGHDIDHPPNDLKNDLARFFADHPEMRQDEGMLVMRKCRRALVARSVFEHAFSMCLIRFNDRPYTLRDARKLELLRPLLLQTIRCVVLAEELAHHKSLIGLISDIPMPMALVNDCALLVFANEALQKELSLPPNGGLPKDLTEALRGAIARYAGADLDPRHFESQPAGNPEALFYRPPGGKTALRLQLDRIRPAAAKSGETVFLLRLKPADDPASLMNLRMQEGMLSNRETEVCCLLRDGFNRKQVGELLFISVDTVQSHIKSIHRKLGVSSRSQLVALLNRAQMAAN